MKLHTGDSVVVIAGKDKGKVARILRILLEQDRVVVAGVNMRTRHIKKTVQGPGRTVRYEASIHRSNVMLVDPKTKKRSRIGFEMRGNKKERVAKRSGEVLLSGSSLRKLAEEETATTTETASSAKTKGRKKPSDTSSS